jgi:flagellar assembly protein FliH
MSICRDFTPEELQALAPWRLPDLGLAPQKPKVEEIEAGEAPPTITAEEIERIQNEARTEAANEGYQEGRQKGQEEGYRQGYEEGLHKGQETGLAEGKQQGYKDGYQEGYNQGRKAGEEEMQAALAEQGQHMQQLLRALDQPLAELDEPLEHELMLLATTLAKQVVRRELKTDPGQIVATIKSAAAALPSASRDISLHLHPEDAALAKSALALADGTSQWKIMEDPLITRGGCRVTSESSSVDASVEKRLAQAIAQVLGDEREHGT